MSTYKQKRIKELKANARGQLIGKYSSAIAAALIVTIAEFIVTLITDYTYTGSVSSYLIRLIISLVVDLLMGILIFGQAHFFLNLLRGKEPLTLGDAFYGFTNNMDKAILVQLPFTLVSLIGTLPAVLINLGLINVTVSSLAIVMFTYGFGIVLSFITKLFLAMSFYVLNDNPDMSVPDILKKSVDLMAKRKGKLILTYLSFIPITIIGICAFFVGIFWVMAFRETTLANFYLDAIGEEPVNPSIDKETATSSDYSI